MIPVGDLFLTEGVWSFMKNSIASILGRRKSTTIRSNEMSDDDKLKSSESIQRRLTPKPLSSTRQKIGFKQIKK